MATTRHLASCVFPRVDRARARRAPPTSNALAATEGARGWGRGRSSTVSRRTRPWRLKRSSGRFSRAATSGDTAGPLGTSPLPRILASGVFLRVLARRHAAPRDQKRPSAATRRTGNATVGPRLAGSAAARPSPPSRGRATGVRGSSTMGEPTAGRADARRVRVTLAVASVVFPLGSGCHRGADAQCLAYRERALEVRTLRPQSTPVSRPLCPAPFLRRPGGGRSAPARGAFGSGRAAKADSSGTPPA